MLCSRPSRANHIQLFHSIDSCCLSQDAVEVEQDVGVIPRQQRNRQEHRNPMRLGLYSRCGFSVTGYGKLPAFEWRSGRQSGHLQNFAFVKAFTLQQCFD
jgi:hypothetical protein